MKSWFEDQIEERRESDRQALEESFQKIASVVLGQRLADKLTDERIVTKQALDSVLKYYHYKPVDIPEEISDGLEQIDYCLRHYGMMRRDIELKEDWYHDAFGPVLGFMKGSGHLVALLPNSFKGYYYIDSNTGKHVKINRKNVDLFENEAICFYKPLPLKKLGIPDLIIYMKSNINTADIMVVVFASLMVSGVGLFLTKITVALSGPVLNSRSTRALVCAAIFIFCITLSTHLISTITELLSGRLNTKTSVAVESAMIMRIIALPVSFHRNYSPGELKSRSMAVNELCKLLQDIFVTTGFTAIASLLYVTQIFRYAPGLVVPSFIIILITVGVSLITTLLQIRVSKIIRENTAKEEGINYSLITGIQKIKLAGAEKRAFARWLNIYSDKAALQYNPPTLLKVSNVINTAISLFSTIIIYYIAVITGVNQSEYLGFTVAYGYLMGAFNSFSNLAISMAQIDPILKMAEPFLKTVPEVSEDREIVTNISGNVEIAHVSFRYSDKTPFVLKDLSLKINAGDYVAIVGKTGCGKSTLIRLLLGFETPESGAIYYDGRDITTLDLGSLRKNIGTVTQDGGLFQGDIYSNIVITNPNLTLDEAWAAAEIAKIADDIKSMPMGMSTVISEGQGGISGGQKQRLMIARAVANKPKLLIFDEATSALDNITQKQVSEALDSMGCTRIVVAHRLSTIKHCDKILVLDQGQIVESGTYDELIEKNGNFAELVARQRLE
ncbi:ATP-binding cassette domain-containing protein [Pseudobutyrivibrio sp.]